jgi:tRNA 2-thiocytidine biosynthesis protein TtcA
MKDYWCTRKKGSVHMSITIAELKNRDKDSYRLIDIRDAIEISHGAVPDAIAVPAEEIETSSEVDKDKLLVIFCARGVVSIDVAEHLKEKGYQAESLEGGYAAWLLDVMSKPEEQNKAKDVELSLRKKFKKSIWSKFTKAINTYELVKPGDKIAVCISGGKDSMLMAKCFQELKLHNKFEFEVKFLVMDPGYSEANRKVIEENAKSLNIPITIFESDIFESVFTVEKSPCYLCARMRRGHLYHFAQELGCNKIALGHHYDDVIETILMGMLYGAQVQTMMPKLHSTNFEGMELIRPLYLVREDDIKAWRDYNGLHFIQCACKFTDTCTTCNNENRSKRVEIKELIQTLKQVNPYVEGNIFKSVENVNLDTVVAWKQHGEKHHFLDAYDRKNICTENDSKE